MWAAQMELMSEADSEEDRNALHDEIMDGRNCSCPCLLLTLLIQICVDLS